MNAITKNIPNSITCLNLLSGCFACLFAYKGEYDIVALCIGLSALFDFLDGMAARLLHAYSPMGKELDSLADLISFGLAPGFMAMHFMLYDSVFHGINDSYQIWWALSALLIPVFSALRLAKFNIDTRQTTSFIGLPVPAKRSALIDFLSIFFLNKHHSPIHCFRRNIIWKEIGFYYIRFLFVDGISYGIRSM